MAAKSQKADYEALAAERIRKPSTLSPRPKILIYARNKVGKTRFCLSAPNVLIADPEHGTDNYIERDPDVWPIESWDDLDDFYKYLRTGKHGYEYAALDGVTRMHNMALNKVMKLQEERDLDRIPGLVRRQDYGKAGELSKRMFYNFLNLPMGVIFTAQERKLTSDNDEASEEDLPQTEYVPDLPAGAKSAMNGIVDVIGRMTVTKVKVRPKGSKEIKEKAQRRLFVGPHPNYDTGYRSDYDLPEVIKNPSLPKLVHLIRTGEEQ